MEAIGGKLQLAECDLLWSTAELEGEFRFPGLETGVGPKPWALPGQPGDAALAVG